MVTIFHTFLPLVIIILLPLTISVILGPCEKKVLSEYFESSREIIRKGFIHGLTSGFILQDLKEVQKLAVNKSNIICEINLLVSLPYEPVIMTCNLFFERMEIIAFSPVKYNIFDE